MSEEGEDFSHIGQTRLETGLTKSQRSFFLMTELGKAAVMTEEIHQEGVALDTYSMMIHAQGVVTETRGVGVTPALTTVSSKVLPRTATTWN